VTLAPEHDTTETRGTRPILVLVSIWLTWAVCLLAFQELVAARLEPERPDRVLGWTARHTTDDRFEAHPYLGGPTLNTHVSFDSEYYLSIALVGFDDDRVAGYEPAGGGPRVSANYAFGMLYPFTMRVVGSPMAWLGVDSLTAMTVAGVAISLAAALAAMVAIYRLARPQLGDDAGVRAGFYLLVFPTGFFLAQVYTEALFLALAFGSLSLMADRRPILAGLLAAAAVLTRPVGIALVLPLALGLAQAVLERRRAGEPIETAWRPIASWAGATLAPLLTYLVWSMSDIGRGFATVQRELGARAAFNLEVAWAGWARALGGWADALPATKVYYALEVAAVVLAVVACLWALRRWPGPALFGLAAVVIAISSGPAQGMVRYTLAAPAIFLFLARLGEHPAFDRGWTIVSVLLLGLLVTLFSVDFWVA
jgi:Mannosyltransferase (PIG-V)